MPFGGRMTRLLLADDHRMLRDSMRRSLEEHGLDVVGEAGDGQDAVRQAQALRPDVVLMDVSMPILDGVEATRQLHLLVPDTQVVMLTMHADGDVMAKAIQAGAVGYLVKDCAITDVVSAVRLAASGESVLSRGLASSMLADVKKTSHARSEGDAPVISAREEEVLQLVADGLSLPEVAAALFIS